MREHAISSVTHTLTACCAFVMHEHRHLRIICAAICAKWRMCSPSSALPKGWWWPVQCVLFMTERKDPSPTCSPVTCEPSHS